MVASRVTSGKSTITSFSCFAMPSAAREKFAKLRVSTAREKTPSPDNSDDGQFAIIWDFELHVDWYSSRTFVVAMQQLLSMFLC